MGPPLRGLPPCPCLFGRCGFVGVGLCSVQFVAICGLWVSVQLRVSRHESVLVCEVL